MRFVQAMARKNEWPLDKMCLQCDVTKKNKEDFSSSPREGAYIHSLYMEGMCFGHSPWPTRQRFFATFLWNVKHFMIFK